MMFASGCERAPLECPAIDVGTLVVTEISGDKSDGGLGQWVELYNAGGAPVNLLGARVEFTTLNGSSTDEFTVRAALTIGAGQYVTFGAEDDDGMQPSHINYVYSDDLSGPLLTTAAAKVIVCGGEVDRVIYRDLPEVGSIALDGSMAPSAVQNDTEANFCVDATGTPQMENQPCT